MSATFPLNIGAYAVAVGIARIGHIVRQKSDPTTTTLQSGSGLYVPGQFLLNTVNGNLWFLDSITSSNGATTANWLQLASSSGTVIAVVGTANEITATTSAGTVTLSIPTTFIAPGSIASTTTVVGTTGVTATTGNVTASAGNLVSGGAGNGLILPVTTVAAGASPLTANARVGMVTFNTISIAAGATQSLVIDNSLITVSTQSMLIAMYGTTTGAAIGIQSVTLAAGTATIVVTNGTGATTQSGNLTFVYELLD